MLIKENETLKTELERCKLLKAPRIFTNSTRQVSGYSIKQPNKRIATKKSTFRQSPVENEAIGARVRVFPNVVIDYNIIYLFLLFI
jgi:hypothetical protein